MIHSPSENPYPDDWPEEVGAYTDTHYDCQPVRNMWTDKLTHVQIFKITTTWWSDRDEPDYTKTPMLTLPLDRLPAVIGDLVRVATEDS